MYGVFHIWRPQWVGGFQKAEGRNKINWFVTVRGGVKNSKKNADVIYGSPLWWRFGWARSNSEKSHPSFLSSPREIDNITNSDLHMQMRQEEEGGYSYSRTEGRKNPSISELNWKAWMDILRKLTRFLLHWRSLSTCHLFQDINVY